jgi:hypothetical protein
MGLRLRFQLLDLLVQRDQDRCGDLHGSGAGGGDRGVLASGGRGAQL